MRTVLIDAGPLIALFAADDRHHWRYRDLVDLADASLYWLATQIGITEIMTVDRNDFERYRLPDGQAFQIV